MMKELFILSCEKKDNGGGIYKYNLSSDGDLKLVKYFACDKPMYAVKKDKNLHVLLREPFNENLNSGYFIIDTLLENPSNLVDTKGLCACHLVVDESGFFIVNYLSGNITRNGFETDLHIGQGINLPRQNEAHTHYVGISPDGKFILCTDLGLDKIYIYNKKLSVYSIAEAEKGFGIRHLVSSKNGKYIFAINELVPSVSMFNYKEGELTLKKTLPLHCSVGDSTGAAIRISDDGGYLYASVREENCIFIIDIINFKVLRKISCGGNGPRDFIIADKFLISCNEKSGDVSLISTENDSVINKVFINSPICAVV